MINWLWSKANKGNFIMCDTVMASQIKRVLAMIDFRLLTEDKAFLRTLENKYSRLLYAIKQGDDLKEYSIRGSVHAFLDAYSNYEDPLITELYKAEQLYIEQLRSDESN